MTKQSAMNSISDERYLMIKPNSFLVLPEEDKSIAQVMLKFIAPGEELGKGIIKFNVVPLHNCEEYFSTEIQFLYMISVVMMISGDDNHAVDNKMPVAIMFFDLDDEKQQDYIMFTFVDTVTNQLLRAKDDPLYEAKLCELKHYLDVKDEDAYQILTDRTVIREYMQILDSAIPSR